MQIKILAWKKSRALFWSNIFLLISKGNWTKPCSVLNMSLETNYGRCLFISCFLGKVGGLGPISCTLYQQLFYYVLLAEIWGKKNPKAKNVDLDSLEGKGKNSKETQICLQDKKYTTNLQIWFDSVLCYNSGSEGIFKK